MKISRLLKIISRINREKINDNELELLSTSQYSKRMILGQQNIEKLFALVQPGTSSNLEYEIQKFETRIIEEILPKTICNLQNGDYDYNWSIRNFEFSFQDLEMVLDIKRSYRQLLELEKLELSYKTEMEYSSIENPIYFDIYYLAIRNKKYFSFLKSILQKHLYNPNCQDCLPSHEPFYGRIMHINEAQDLYLSIMLDERTDFNQLVNGSDQIESCIYFTKRQYDEKKTISPYFPALLKALKERKISIIDTIRFRGDKKVDIGRSYITKLIECLNDYDEKEIQDFLNYFVTDDAIEKQIQIAKFPSLHRDNAIDEYCNFIIERRGKEVEVISRLKKLKLNDE